MTVTIVKIVVDCLPRRMARSMTSIFKDIKIFGDPNEHRLDVAVPILSHFLKMVLQMKSERVDLLDCLGIA